MTKLNRLFLTWFGCGYVPRAPGTAGSIGALPICWMLIVLQSWPVTVLVAIGLTVLAVLSASIDQKSNSVHDPQYIVIDEVCGMLFAVLGASSTAISTSLLIAFVLFRILDIIKPFPANFFDRLSSTATTPRMRAIGIVLDDVIAGIYAALILKLVLLLLMWWGLV